jgi:RNA polymerase-interacting CarD/CdnL/TRCF family regulator
VGEDNAVLAELPEPGEPVFYPKVGHCIYRGVTEDRVAPGTQLLELEDLEEGSRILIPLPRVPELNLRAAGTAFQDIQEVLAAEFEDPIEDEDERHKLIETLITDGSPRSLALSLKRLHLLRQTTGLSREEEQTRKKVRSWLAAEVSISRDSTRAEAQAFMTRILQETMAGHEKKEKEEAKERRRAAREQKKAQEAAADALVAGGPNVADVFGPPLVPEAEPAETAKPSDTVESVESGGPVESAGHTDVVPPETPPGTTDVAPDHHADIPRRAEEGSPPVKTG